MSFNHSDGIKPNYRLKALIMEVVDNQMKANDPPITNETFKRLVDDGYSEKEAKEKIATVVVEHIYDIMKGGSHFNEKKYVKDLKSLK